MLDGPRPLLGCLDFSAGLRPVRDGEDGEEAGRYLPFAMVSGGHEYSHDPLAVRSGWDRRRPVRAASFK